MGGRTRSVIPVAFEGTRLHLLKTERKRALHRTAFHRLAGQIQRAGARGAVIVDVNDRYPAQADVIQRRLATGGVAVHITGIRLLDQAIVQVCILQCLTNGAGTHLDVGPAGARFDKRNHANTGNVGFVRHCCSPESLSCTRLLTPQCGRAT
ncbi:hypothetical protein D3C80_1353510 [compost metagenome]